MTRLAAIVLAAGASRRFGDADKLLADLDGAPVLAHVLKRVVRLPLTQRLAVVRPAADEIEALCRSKGFDLVFNEDTTRGIGGSIAAGVRRLIDADAVLLALGDMPFIKAETDSALMAALDRAPSKTIVAPLHDGRRGHPVLFRRVHFDALRALKGDAGAGAVIASNNAALERVSVDDPGILKDIDTPADLP